MCPCVFVCCINWCAWAQRPEDDNRYLGLVLWRGKEHHWTWKWSFFSEPHPTFNFRVPIYFSSQCWSYRFKQFLHVCWDLNFGPHAWAASNLFTAPISQPLYSLSWHKAMAAGVFEELTIKYCTSFLLLILHYFAKNKHGSLSHLKREHVSLVN